MRLIITEKHDAANKISSILFPGRKTDRVSGVTVYRSAAGDTAVVGLAGHIVELDFPPELERWSACPPRSLIRSNIVKKPLKPDIIAAIVTLGKDAGKVTIATDYDREGELIGIEAYHLIRRVSKADFDRVRYSSFTKEEIENAFKTPVSLDFNMAAAGESRQEIDLIWGAALTRFISLAGNRAGKDFLSVGRVQTPLLAMIVDREKEIETFISKAYWEIVADIIKAESIFTARHKKGRFERKEEAEAAYKRLGRIATVTSVASERKKDPPPMPFNTTEFLKAANALGVPPTAAMQVAEDLYINGYISYPRTDNTVYPPTLDLRAILILFKGSPEFDASASELLAVEKLVPSRGKVESKDHPPIYPVACAKKAALDDRHWKLYELVARRFFATLSPPCEWDSFKAELDIGGEPFVADGKSLVSPGWRKHYPYGMPDEKALPPLKKGEQLPVKKSSLLEKKTEPPKRYGQGKLIQMMEDANLGTKATRHEALAKLYSRGYVKDTPPQPTKLAVTLIDALKANAAAVTSPAMTAALERDMDAIVEASKKKEDVVNVSRIMLEGVFDALEKHRADIGSALNRSVESPLGPCPLCGSPLVIRETRADHKKFIACNGYPACRNTYPMPEGRVRFDKKICDKHKLHIIKVTQGGGKAGSKTLEYGCPACIREGRQNGTGRV